MKVPLSMAALILVLIAASTMRAVMLETIFRNVSSCDSSVMPEDAGDPSSMTTRPTVRSAVTRASPRSAKNSRRSCVTSTWDSFKSPYLSWVDLLAFGATWLRAAVRLYTPANQSSSAMCTPELSKYAGSYRVRSTQSFQGNTMKNAGTTRDSTAIVDSNPAMGWMKAGAAAVSPISRPFLYSDAPLLTSIGMILIR